MTSAIGPAAGAAAHETDACSPRFAHLVFARDRAQVAGWTPPRPQRAACAPSLRSRSWTTADPEPELDPEEAALTERICRRAGIDVRRYRSSVLRRRLPACLRALGVTLPAAASAVIELQPAGLERALGALLIGVTEFFRDAPAFTALQAELPALVATLPEGRELRVLGLGCSTGQELYSVAMLLAELDALVEPGQLLGIDAREAAIERARAGVYSPAAVACLERGRRKRWIEPAGLNVRIVGELLTACRFEVGDVFAAAGPRTVEVDLVLCRNLAIYLEPAASAELWSSISARLRPGGLLLTGKAERPGAPFEPIGPCLYRRASSSAPLSPAPERA